MEKTSEPRGWHIHHTEQLFFKATVGAPTIRLKFYTYPSYRQTVHLEEAPAHCKLKKKGHNAFFLFQQKVHSKGVISLERKISVFPQSFLLSPNDDWGKISNIPRLLQRKYQQSFSYWPVSSPSIRNVSEEYWFMTDELNTWVQTASRYITTKIKYPEKQDKRLGADQAFLSGIGDCDEFTDLFITLSRMRGVPCRRITGLFITRRGAEVEPHAWGEILSPTIGWIPIDIALHNLGKHTNNYVVGKIEEFNPALLDYQIQRQSAAVHYHWERPPPQVTPLY
jgi:transglutaminase-like putative cysteine protease